MHRKIGTHAQLSVHEPVGFTCLSMGHIFEIDNFLQWTSHGLNWILSIKADQYDILYVLKNRYVLRHLP
jgi:hypothetical protein